MECSVAVASQSHSLKFIALALNCMFTKERTRLEIIAEILSSCKKPQNKTGLRQKVNLSWHTLTVYLDQIRPMGLLENLDGSTRYLVTQKGRRFLEEWKELVDSLQ